MAATNAAEFIQLGGTRADLKYDIARGWVTVTDRAPPPAREKKAKQERGELVFEQNIPKLRSQVPPPTKDDEAIARAAQCVCVRKSHFMTAVERPRHRRDVCAMARRLTTVSTQAGRGGGARTRGPEGARGLADVGAVRRPVDH